MKNTDPLTFILGPCAIESREHAHMMAAKIKGIMGDIPWVYKSSFDKANRTSKTAMRGVGMVDGLSILEEVKDRFAVPVITDVHETFQVPLVAKVVDYLQIPAFLSRQTDLLQLAGAMGKPVLIKKGQFMSSQQAYHAAEKVGLNAIICERGTTFGYDDLVVDVRHLRSAHYPTVIDATHSGSKGMFIETIARAAVVQGIAGVFMEVHDDPPNAISDGALQLPISELGALVARLQKIDALVKNDL